MKLSSSLLIISGIASAAAVDATFVTNGSSKNKPHTTTLAMVRRSLIPSTSPHEDGTAQPNLHQGSRC
eukprot:11380727-Ditylum_brightwellii.AAC.1